MNRLSQRKIGLEIRKLEAEIEQIRSKSSEKKPQNLGEYIGRIPNFLKEFGTTITIVTSAIIIIFQIQDIVTAQKEAAESGYGFQIKSELIQLVKSLEKTSNGVPSTYIPYLLASFGISALPVLVEQLAIGQGASVTAATTDSLLAIANKTDRSAKAALSLLVSRFSQTSKQPYSAENSEPLDAMIRLAKVLRDVGKLEEVDACIKVHAGKSVASLCESSEDSPAFCTSATVKPHWKEAVASLTSESCWTDFWK